MVVWIVIAFVEWTAGIEISPRRTTVAPQNLSFLIHEAIAKNLGFLKLVTCVENGITCASLSMDEKNIKKYAEAIRAGYTQVLPDDFISNGNNNISNGNNNNAENRPLNLDDNGTSRGHCKFCCEEDCPKFVYRATDGSCRVCGCTAARHQNLNYLQ